MPWWWPPLAMGLAAGLMVLLAECAAVEHLVEASPAPSAEGAARIPGEI